MTSKFPVEIKTKNLLMIYPDVNHAEKMFESYASDLSITKYLVWAAHQNSGESRDYIKRCQEEIERGDELHYFICVGDSFEIIGMISADLDKHIATIGYVLARPYWGRGLMSEAVKAFIQILFQSSDIRRIEATCDIENLASSSVLQKCGMRLEGLLRCFAIHPQLSSQPRDCFIFARCV